MQDQLETIGILVLKGVVIPLVGIFITWATLYLPSLIKTKVKNASAAGILERLSMLAFSVVAEVQQTVITALDEPTPEKLAAARDLAIATLKSHLGDKGIKELEVVLGLDGSSAVEKLLITFIESAVHNLKLTKKTEPAVPVVPVVPTPAPTP